MSVNPIRYTSRDFVAILADINSDPNLVDKEDWWKRIWAGIGDVLSMQLNAGFNNAYLRTAFTRRAVVDILGLINFQLTSQQTASGNVIFYLDQSTIFPLTVLGSDIAASTAGSLSSGSLRFESRASSQTVNAFSENPTFNVGAGPGAAGTLTITRAYTTGEKVVFTATTGALPTGLSLNTAYYVIAINSTTIQLATTIANAYGAVPLAFSTAGSGSATMALYSFQAAVYQQTSVAQYSVGSGDGITDWQTFDLNDVDVLQDTLVVTINSQTWTRVDNPVYSSATDKVFRLVYNDDGSSYLEFGNGVYGAVAPNFEVYVSYAYGGGVASNVALANQINSYSGNNASIEGCSNSVALSGGADAMDIDTAKQEGPLVSAVQNRFITSGDGEALILAYGGISLALVIPNYYGPNSAEIVAIATGGGNPSSALQTALVSYLTPLTLFGSAILAFANATLTTETVTIAIHLNSGYSFATTQFYVQLAAQLFFTERGAEIGAYYAANGLADTVTLINSIWSYSFGASDYMVIGNLLTNLSARQFGDYLTVDMLTTFIEQNILAVNYATVSSPAFPITLGATEITTISATPTVTQI